MEEQRPTSPFINLGKQLKALRDRIHETLAEASGAVEIDVKQLASFELGHSRPSEDVLLLLISHFGAKDDEAVRLWELAGYKLDKIPVSRMTNDDIQLQANIQSDKRILFTDVVDVIVNNYGVVMNFMQSAGPNIAPTPVARVGMSREHAKSVLEILQMTLKQTDKSQKLPENVNKTENTSPEEA
jgi:transcriptional regulator with XRE-family HTH domain